MQGVSGRAVILALAVLTAAFMAGVYFTSRELRQDYHVLSVQDRDRPDVGLTRTHALWLEPSAQGGTVIAYDLATRHRITLEAAAANLHAPILADGRFAAWVEGTGPLVAFIDDEGGQWTERSAPYHIRVWDLAANTSTTLGTGADNLTLPGRTLADETLVVAGQIGADRGLWTVSLPPSGALQRLNVTAPPGSSPVLAHGRLWWANGTRVDGYDLRGASMTAFQGSGPVRDLAASGDLLAWTSEENGTSRVQILRFANDSAPRALSTFPGKQTAPALGGERAVFIQRDGLVRAVELATGEEHVLPARTDDNTHLRVAGDNVVWLSRTLEGRNVVLVPFRATPAGS